MARSAPQSAEAPQALNDLEESAPLETSSARKLSELPAFLGEQSGYKQGANEADFHSCFNSPLVGKDYKNAKKNNNIFLRKDTV